MENQKMGDAYLSKEDLFILLETYQNSIQLNTTLLEKQNAINEKQDALLNKQKQLCDNINKVIHNLSELAKELHDVQQIMNKDCESKQKNLITAIGSVSEKIDSQSISTVKDHSNLNVKIYVALGSMGGIIAALIGLLITAYNKMEVIESIAKHLGVY
jgi:uncharacterized protein YoxC